MRLLKIKQIHLFNIKNEKNEFKDNFKDEFKKYKFMVIFQKLLFSISFIYNETIKKGSF